MFSPEIKWVQSETVLETHGINTLNRKWYILGDWDVLSSDPPFIDGRWTCKNNEDFLIFTSLKSENRLFPIVAKACRVVGVYINAMKTTFLFLFLFLTSFFLQLHLYMYPCCFKAWKKSNILIESRLHCIDISDDSCSKMVEKTIFCRSVYLSIHLFLSWWNQGAETPG